MKLIYKYRQILCILNLVITVILINKEFGILKSLLVAIPVILFIVGSIAIRVLADECMEVDNTFILHHTDSETESGFISFIKDTLRSGTDMLLKFLFYFAIAFIPLYFTIELQWAFTLFISAAISFIVFALTI